MNSDPVPTMRLQFRAKTVYDERGDDCYVSTKLILQQWWEWTVTGYGTPFQEGEWRDVPVAEESV